MRRRRGGGATPAIGSLTLSSVGRYSVAVDSSVLGADSDGYVNRYTELRDQHHDPALLRLDTGERGGRGAGRGAAGWLLLCVSLCRGGV